MKKIFTIISKCLFTIIAKKSKRKPVAVVKRDSKGRFVKGNQPWNKGINSKIKN